ncbi:FAD-binding oxidoreductase [Pseudobacteriovorax antillogorgiicola]|uniref:FAD/FMN-containing dehydrogenase n=1 Tax=Pseudobacteriovorax antillogorgiicola TaxID=1513793 RepID=A0A1Y6CN98_9BACT|nr:FAD-binding oxidoreductase [Pseudobacteriovorax antillogorgiicola]TCS44583.1 FAD/FMN-containing dehydrogenase [Pseudobacteriovorax antillogorgiicola]SMF78039.1 FAD/FMN-containing dehydrogenase [Pseudobacteriovorax antillogorgiicola]
MSQFLSWGRYFPHKPSQIRPIAWRDEFTWLGVEPHCLAYGLGRSYGDSCLNHHGVLIPTRGLNRLIAWDDETNILRCEAGVSLGEVLEFAVPRGSFLPVSPGTKFVTVGGAIANDIHGKNHHSAGTFGRYVKAFGLLRSNGEELVCSPASNADLYRATIGGLGLTGLITWADIQLKYASPVMAVENVPFEGLDEFFNLCESSEHYEYTVAWMDCIDAWNRWGRGIFMRANHSPDELPNQSRKPSLSVPFSLPSFVLNRYSCKAFNEAYYYANSLKQGTSLKPYEPYFYPLDMVHHWNRIYGSRGFFQYQLVVPLSEKEAFAEIFNVIAKSGLASFLVVLKKFGNLSSPGMMSFPMEGYTLTLDFSHRPGSTKATLKRLTDIVNEAHGRLYPAKDSVMTPEDFERYYPQWRQFSEYKDPKFSSSFWRRVAPTSQ